MEQRIDAAVAAPEAFKAMLAFSSTSAKLDLEPSLKELVKIRASQINGCAFCLHMHMRDARKLGETEERIVLLDAWREAPYYTPRERAALAWTEAVTLVSETHVPDDVYEEARRHFNERELTELTVAIMIINSWNRLLVAMRRPVDVDYRGR